MTDDALLGLSKNETIAATIIETQKVLDELAWFRPLRNNKENFLSFARRASGYANAALDGATMPPDPRIEPDDSAMGELSNLGLVITAEADLQTQNFRHSPIQVWARLHSLIDNSPQRGTLRNSTQASDSLHLGALADFEVLAPRLQSLANDILTTKAPAILTSAIVHAEISTLRPFTNHSHLIARTSTRLVFAARDIEPIFMPEFGMYSIGRTNLVKALTAYRTGTIAGLAEYVLWYCESLNRGSQLAKAAVEEITSSAK